MKNIKTIAMALTLMTTFTFADFTVKDLFVSGGADRPVDTKENQKKEHDCQ